MLAALLVASALLQEPPQRALPEGTAAERALAALRGGVEPRVSAMASWRDPAAWKTWIGDLAGEQASAAPDPERRARLALFALEQQRWTEAWEHFARSAADPALAAGLLPRFLPGVPADAGAARDGFPAALRDGIVLRPALPPARGDAPPGRIERREMRLERLQVGEALLSLRVAVEYDGVLVEVGHLSGPACKLALVLPCEPGYAFANEYVDWYVQPTHGEPLALALEPGQDVHALYGRLEPRPAAGPERLPERLPALVEREGLVLEILPGDEAEHWIEALAASLRAPPLGIAARTWIRGSKERPKGLCIDLARPDERAVRVSDLCGAIERFVLAARR